MKYYLFPFNLIEKGSRIVLYAAGDVGRDYYRQICDIDYCKVVLWLDQNPDGKTVFSPETIKNLCDDQYDLVLIAIKSHNVANKIQNSLIDLGVLPQKIFYQPTKQSSEILKWGMSNLNLNALLTNTQAVKDALSDYIFKSDGTIEFFWLLIHEIKRACEQNESSRAEILQKAEKIVENELKEPEKRLVLLRVLFDAECFSPDLFQLFVKYTGEISRNISQKYWLVQDTNFMWFYYPNILYDGFFTDKQNLLRDYAIELDLAWNPPKYHKDNNRNICFVVHGLSPNCVSQSLSPIVKEMHDRDYILHLISLNPVHNDAGANFLKPKYVLIAPDILYKDEMREYYLDEIRLYYPSSATMHTRQQDILDLICEINPYCIIDVTDETSIISYYYSQNYPTIYLPMRLPGYSSIFFHKILISLKNCSMHPPLHIEQALDTSACHDIKLPQKAFLRGDYGFTDDDIIVITVGYRLLYDIRPVLINQFCSALLKDSKIKWLCVGLEELPYLNQHYPELIGEQVFFIGYEDDLPGLYGMCDIYLNPERVGGGVSIAWAMQQGLAMVSPLGATAGVGHIGKEFSVNTEADLVPCVLEMAKNPALLKQNKDKMLEISSTWSKGAYADTIIKGMDELAEKFDRILKESSNNKN